MDLLALLEQRKIFLPAQSDSAEIALDDVLVQVLAVRGDDDRPVKPVLVYTRWLPFWREK